jgi:hypothetical protein
MQYKSMSLKYLQIQDVVDGRFTNLNDPYGQLWFFLEKGDTLSRQI